MTKDNRKKIYYFIYILNGVSFKEAAFDKDFIINFRNKIAKTYNVNLEDMPIFTE